MLLVCLTLTTPVTFAFVPIHALSLGVENISLYFIAAGVVSIAARLVLGRQLDRGSRGTWVVGGYLLLAVGFLVFTQARSLEGFIVAAVFTASGASLTHRRSWRWQWTARRLARMGKAMATYSMFYRVGEGLGAPLAGALIVAFGFTGMYLGALAIILTGSCSPSSTGAPSATPPVATPPDVSNHQDRISPVVRHKGRNRLESAVGSTRHDADVDDRLPIEWTVDVGKVLAGAVVAPRRRESIEVDREEQVPPRVIAIVFVRDLRDSLQRRGRVDKALVA